MLMKPLICSVFRMVRVPTLPAFSDFTMMPCSLIPGTDSILDDIQMRF